jgi:hypothetical protein
MTDLNTELAITPETKIGTLLDKYPQLESLLISMSPTYKKLRNPVLRKTVGKIASLKQVAQIGGFPVSELVNTLRRELGQTEISGEKDGDAPGEVSPAPDWVTELEVAQTLDAKEMIDAGETPLGRVMEEIKDLGGNNSYLLITPFRPAPLIDTLKKKGYRLWCTETEKGLFKTYIAAPL